MRRSRLSEARNWGSGLERQRAALAAANVEVGYVWVHGVRLRYARSPGDGEPLLFCNGIGANFELLLPFVRALPNVLVVLFDVPGAGGSAPRWFWPSFAIYSRYAIGVLDQLGYSGSFNVAGISWGGGLAQQIARDYPSRVRRLILIATSPGITMFPGRVSALVRMVTPQRYLSRTFMVRNAAVIYGGEMRGRADLAITHAGLTRAPAILTFTQQMLAMAQFSSLLWLHRIKCPALILSGDDDPLIRPINARILTALLPNSRLHIVQGGGHLFLSLRPEETAEIVLEFLDTVVDPASPMPVPDLS